MREVDRVYVDDVVAAFVAAAESEKAPGSTLDIGSGELLPIRSLVERIVPLVGGDVRPVFGALPDRPGERPRSPMSRRAGRRSDGGHRRRSPSAWRARSSGSEHD